MKLLSLWNLVLSVPVVGALAFAIFQPVQVLPRIALAPGFALMDQNRNILTSEDLRGTIILYTFTYTNCSVPCPQANESMQGVQAMLNDMDTGSIPVMLVTVFFDPVRDTPEALAAYARMVGGDESVWRFVTGEAAQLKEIIGGTFNTYYRQNDDGTFTFDPTFVLVDGWGIQRARYRTSTPDLEIVARDIRLLAEEAHNSKGITKYAYEAAHLFLCHP